MKHTADTPRSRTFIRQPKDVDPQPSEPGGRTLDLDHEIDLICRLLWQSREVRSLFVQDNNLWPYVQSRIKRAQTMHPDDMGADNIYRKFADAKLPRQGWKDRYCSADRCRKLPVQLAPEGTDFMPVRCLVVRTKSSSGDFDTRVLLGADGWVITGESNQAVIEIAAAHGLNMSRRLFRPAASGRHRA